MAPPKPKKSLLENPSTESSSEDEEVGEEEEEEEQKREAGEEEGKTNSSSAVIKPKSDPKTSSFSSDDDEEEEDESEKEEESDSEPVTPPKLKPKKTLSKPSSVTPLKPSTTVKKKRPLESEKDSKLKKKKKVDDEGEEDEEESERSEKNNMLFQRLWSDEDEIVILKGMIKSKKKGIDPLSDLSKFLESIKKSLDVKEVREEQLKNKIKRLKKKFMNNCKRAKGDEDPVFSKPHEQRSYTLMKQIWGGRNSVVVANGKDDDSVVVVADGKRSSNRLETSQNAAVTGSALRTKTTTLSGISMMELDESNGSLHPCVQEWIYPRNNMNMVVGGSFLKQGLDLIGDSKKMDLDQKWSTLIAADLKLYLRRVELVREQTVAVLDAHKASDALEHE